MNRLYILFLSIFVVLCFFISLVTLGEYGVNWDTFQHLARGQDYFLYLTTGKTNNNSVSSYQNRKSYYEGTDFDFAWANKMTIGHPPLNDILLVASNQLLFKYGGILSDIQSYHIVGVFLVFVGACIIFVWSYELFGPFASFISVISYYSFPILFSEQHFNIKDPAVMVYMLGFLYFFWRGVTKKNIWNIGICGVWLGLSLGTKFNIVFVPFFLLPWIIFYFFSTVLQTYKKISFQTVALMYRKEYTWIFTLAMLAVPVVGFLLFFGTYPALWKAPIAQIGSVISYYRDIGGSPCHFYPFTPQWAFFCFDRTTVLLLYTIIPIPTLFFSFVGILYGYKKITHYGMAPLLWILMLFVTAVRVVLPISALYGGSLRQIMEIIIPLSLLSGLGAYGLKETCLKTYGKKPYISIAVVSMSLVCYMGVCFRMISLHPHENLYRNVIGTTLFKASGGELVNGVVSYGNAYKSAVDWINMHAEKDATVSLVTGISSAIPTFLFRPDISYGAKYWSGWKEHGEYLLELVDPGSHITSFFSYRYVMHILQPIYEKKVDGYPIVRVWRNDRRFLKVAYRKETQRETMIDVDVRGSEVVIPLKRPTVLKQILMKTPDESCKKALGESYILLSEDGTTFVRMYEEVAVFASEAKEAQVDALYNFSGERMQFIKVFIHGNTPCDLRTVSYDVIYFSE